MLANARPAFKTSQPRLRAERCHGIFRPHQDNGLHAVAAGREFMRRNDLKDGKPASLE